MAADGCRPGSAAPYDGAALARSGLERDGGSSASPLEEEE